MVLAVRLIGQRGGDVEFLRLDMLPGLKPRIQGLQGPVPVSLTIAQGVLSLVFAGIIPAWGILRLARATPYPPRSHAVSAGLTFSMPYGRSLRS